MTGTIDSDNPFDKLRRAREASGESVEALAERAGVDAGWLAGLEDGGSPDDREKLGLVGNALSLDLSKIFGTRRRRTSRTRGKTATATSSMDSAVRKAIKAEVEPLARKIRDLSADVAALKKALRDVATVAVKADKSATRADKAAAAAVTKATAASTRAKASTATVRKVAKRVSRG
jgi:transcriptional regulator with XRE-family HTH domain